MAKNSTPDKKLSANQLRGIEALLRGDSREAAALVAGVHTRTLYRWLNDSDCEHFQAELSRRQTRAISYASIRLTGGIETCAEYLLDVIKDESAPASVRVRAALGWLDRQIKFVEVNEILVRLEQLEGVVNA